MNFNLPDYTFEETERIFSEYGWYIPPFIEIRIVFELVELFDNKNVLEAENHLINYFKKNLKKIESELIESHPERKDILTEAFKAHRKKLFYSSTILFLSQADGVCDSIIFRGREIGKIKNNDENHPIINILAEKNSLTDYYNNETKNSNYFSDLNRHGVMHGISNNYGNELNSLKALSLVCCVSDFKRYNKKYYSC
ncbi:hypothetical protein [Urechidicola vernalis]|uniref:Uncharacterized protein n=1 Tax=Urechidicola vernalis TaxID=3075600 RepID=A0ABU2Y0M7_9FLAO|nr:hypothetical protein [Urechidicola sp. P050]MDT0551721.1 hypothetical protein [Urechidicola sp. P050]